MIILVVHIIMLTKEYTLYARQKCIIYLTKIKKTRMKIITAIFYVVCIVSLFLRFLYVNIVIVQLYLEVFFSYFFLTFFLSKTIDFTGKLAFLSV